MRYSKIEYAVGYVQIDIGNVGVVIIAFGIGVFTRCSHAPAIVPLWNKILVRDFASDLKVVCDFVFVRNSAKCIEICGLMNKTDNKSQSELMCIGFVQKVIATYGRD